jgi:hypothetical protein
MMPIRVVLKDGLYGPEIFCDVCHERIDKARKALAEYEVGLDGQPGDAVLFTHVGTCTFALEDREGHKHSQPLDAFLVYLQRNVRFDQKEAEETADGMILG